MPDVKTPVLDNRMGPVLARAFFYTKKTHHLELLWIGLDQSHMPALAVAIHHPIGINDRPFTPDFFLP